MVLIKKIGVFLTGDKDSITNVLDDIGYKIKYIPKQDEYAHPSWSCNFKTEW